jgi:hypothetical protein
MERVKLGEPEKFSGEAREASSNIPLKFDLGKTGG